MLQEILAYSLVNCQTNGLCSAAVTGISSITVSLGGGMLIANLSVTLGLSFLFIIVVLSMLSAHSLGKL